MHQRADQHALLASLLELGDMRWCKLLTAAKHNTPSLGELNAVHLALGRELRLKLGNGAQHMEEQPARRVAGVDLLVEHLEVDALAPELLSDLAEV